jgi:hypothetical protein
MLRSKTSGPMLAVVLAFASGCSASGGSAGPGGTGDGGTGPGEHPDAGDGGASSGDGSTPSEGGTSPDGAMPPPSDAGIVVNGVLPADRIIDWTHAGVVQPNGTQGIPSFTNVCKTIDAATYGNGTTDVSATLQAAIDACPAGQVVMLPAGTYLLSNSLTVNGSVVLRGTGPSTKIVENDANIQFGTQPTQLYQTNWTAGLTQGTTTITLDDASNLKVGQPVVLDQLNDTDVATAGYVPLVNPTGNEGTVGIGVDDCASRSGLSFCTDGNTAVPRALVEMAEVTAIQGNQVTLDRPIYYTHTASLSPQAFFWGEKNVSYAGVESLRIDSQYNAQTLAFAFCTNCWVKAVEVDHITRAAVSLYYDDHFEFRDSYLYMNQATAPTNYGVEVDDTAASRFENNIFDSMDIGVIVSWSSNGNVIAYNYSVNESPGSQVLGGAHGTHSVHTFMNLFEGNTAAKIGFDYVWGSTSHQTLFRNRLTGYMAPRTSSGQPGGDWSNGNWPLFLEAWNRDFNVVGNVLGTAGVQNGYQAATAADGNLVGATGHDSTCQDTCGMGVGPIYILGYWDSWNATSNAAQFDLMVVSTLWRWGNFDYSTNETHYDPTEIPSDETVPTTQTLPPSLYLNQKPSWFGATPFPAIGPDVTGMASKLPAENCYESQNVGSGGTFDPSSCY